MSLIENERTKLIATLLNNCGVGAFVAGVIAPTYGLIAQDQPRVGSLMAVQAFWFLAGIVLHYLASRVLGRLKE